MKKIILCIAASFLIACGNSRKAMDFTESSANQSSSYVSEFKSEDSHFESYDGQILTYTGYVTIQTTDYKKSIDSLKELMTQYEVRLAESEENIGTLRYVHYNLQVPSAKFDSFLEECSNLGDLRYRSTNAQDITREFNDQSIKIEALETQIRRLQEMLNGAETIDDMITIESRLSNLQTELNQSKSYFESLKNQVDYSTLNLTLEEVKEYIKDSPIRKNATFFDRLLNAFRDSFTITTTFLENVLFLAIRLFPLIMIFILGFFLYRKRKVRESALLQWKNKKDKS